MLDRQYSTITHDIMVEWLHHNGFSSPSILINHITHHNTGSLILFQFPLRSSPVAVGSNISVTIIQYIPFCRHIFNVNKIIGDSWLSRNNRNNVLLLLNEVQDNILDIDPNCWLLPHNGAKHELTRAVGLFSWNEFKYYVQKVSIHEPYYYQVKNLGRKVCRCDNFKLGLRWQKNAASKVTAVKYLHAFLIWLSIKCINAIRKK